MFVLNFPKDHLSWFMLLALLAFIWSAVQFYAGYHYGLFIYEEAFKDKPDLYISRESIEQRRWRQNAKDHKWRKRVIAYALHHGIFYFSCSLFGFAALYLAVGLSIDIKDWSQVTPGTATILTALFVILIPGVSGVLARILFFKNRIP